MNKQTAYYTYVQAITSQISVTVRYGKKQNLRGCIHRVTEYMISRCVKKIVRLEVTGVDIICHEW